MAGGGTAGCALTAYSPRNMRPVIAELEGCFPGYAERFNALIKVKATPGASVNNRPMNSNDNWLVHEHSLYENLLSRLQHAAEIEDWKEADLAFNSLVTHLKQHMALEEEVLYPAYESTPHAPQGPTVALREEHSTIVRLIQDMARVIKTRDSEHVLECLTHLEYQMIKHHEKEEDIFLPMASHILDTSREEILRKMEAFDGSKMPGKWDI
jgi:iron-sulfur cluster repair protein YtfE (RIC family)